MPNATSPAGVDAALALAFAKQSAMERQRATLREEVDQWENERDSLASFIPAVFLTDAGVPAIPPVHLRRIIEVLEDDSLGDTLIIAPPGSAKTNTLIGACAWWLGNDPSQHLGFFSNTDRQAYRRSVAVRDTVTRNGKYTAIFPEVLPDRGKGWAEFEWFLRRPDVSDKDATFMAAGVGSAIQGSRLDRILLDDIADERNMATQLQRDKVRYWLQHEVMTRRAPRSRAVMICTRWHEEDPAAWAIEQGWRVIHLPALVTQEDGGYGSYWPGRWPLTKLACPGDHHGQADAAWEPSEEQPNPPCWVERAPDGRIVAQGNCWKFILGARGFELVYQGNAAPEEGAMFKRTKWNWYEIMPARTPRGGTFVDTATSGKGDFFAFATWRTSGAGFYLERVYNQRIRFNDQVTELTYERARTQREDEEIGLPIYVGAEPKAQALIDSLNKLLGGVIGVSENDASKVARAEAGVPYQEAGNLYLPLQLENETKAEYIDRCGDIEAFIAQHASFPGGAHDDMVDTTSLMIRRLATRAGPQNTAPTATAVEYVARAVPGVDENVSEAKAAYLKQQEEQRVKAKQIEQRQHLRPREPAVPHQQRKRGGV